MGTTLHALRRAAESLKVQLPLFETRSPIEFDAVFSAMAKQSVDAVQVVDDPMFLGNLRAIAQLAAKTRLPSNGAKEFAEAGGLIAYGPSRIDLYRRAATFVDKILKGAKPGDLPIEQPTKYDLIINLKTAKRIGLTIPRAMIQRADRVIQ